MILYLLLFVAIMALGVLGVSYIVYVHDTKIDYLDAKKMAIVRHLNTTIESKEAVNVIE